MVSKRPLGLNIFNEVLQCECSSKPGQWSTENSVLSSVCMCMYACVCVSEHGLFDNLIKDSSSLQVRIVCCVWHASDCWFSSA